MHDPRAFALGGVAGHAGLFSTADDVARYATAILSGGGGVLSAAGVASMTTPRVYGDRDLRALGWDVDTAYSSCRGDLFPIGSFGHTGWTGTSLWIDPSTGVYVVVLTSRVHPAGGGNVVALRSRVASIAAAAVTDVAPEAIRRASEPFLPLALAAAHCSGPRPGPRCGRSRRAAVVRRAGRSRRARVDGLRRDRGQEGRPADEPHRDRARRADDRGRAALAEGPRQGRHPRAPLLSRARTLRRAGRRGRRHHGSRDQACRSCRSTAKRSVPHPADLAGLDAVVVDLQDAGARFYTYLTSVGWLMEECREGEGGRRRARPPGPDRRRRGGGSAGRPRAALLHRRPHAAGAHGHDDRRGGADGRGRAPARRRAEGRAARGLAAWPLLRRDRACVGGALAEPAHADAGRALPGRGAPRDDERLRRPRHRHAVRGRGRAVDRRRDARAHAEPAAAPRGALRAGGVHPVVLGPRRRSSAAGSGSPSSTAPR